MDLIDRPKSIERLERENDDVEILKIRKSA